MKILSADDYAQPAKALNLNQPLPTATFCSSAEAGASSCNGDSGGPVLTQKSDSDPWYQMGIVSFGSSFSCMFKAPAVYTRVSEYLDWIDSVLEP